MLFDNRTSYLNATMTTRYALSSRTSITMGGSQYSVHRQSKALVGVRGYTLDGTIQRQISRDTSIGTGYTHLHFDYPNAFGESDINVYNGSWARRLGRTWTLRLTGGVFAAAVQGVQSTALDPSIAALLGISSIRTIFYKENLLPMGSVNLSKRFRRANFAMNYGRTVMPGNGVYLTSRQETYGGSFAYTGFRRFSFSATASNYKIDSLGQNLRPYSQLMASTSASYHVTGGLNVSATYARRRQDLQVSTFQQDSSRMSFSIVFSPGTVPVSFR